MRNRDERLVADLLGRRAQCDWQWTSDIHIAKVFPPLGRWLLRRAIRDWPIILQAKPVAPGKGIQISFVIGHRGPERLPHLLLTLQSIASQRGVSFECIVVEQSAIPEVKEHLPSWVRYVHTPLPDKNMPYSRAWAFNVGARYARTEVLVLHDNDMLVPADYAKEVIARLEEGFEVINLKRFIFYLSADHSAAVLSGKLPLAHQPPQEVVQNLEAGGSFAIIRGAFFGIGGFDESFLGWGGEDNEFWERAQTLSVWPYGYLPLVHLWHEAQPGKFDQKRGTAQLLEQRSSIPAKKRIEELRKRNVQADLAVVGG